MEAGTSGFLSISDSDRRVPAELGQESQASSCLSNGTLLASRVVQGVSGPLTSCVWNLRVFPEDAWGCQCPFVLCFHPQVFLRKGVTASRSYQEQTGKSGSFGLWHHPRGYVSNFLVRPASSLGALERSGTPSRHSRGIDTPVAITRGEGAQMKWFREPRCSFRVRPVCRGTSGVTSRVPSTVSHFKTERGTTLETL